MDINTEELIVHMDAINALPPQERSYFIFNIIVNHTSQADAAKIIGLCNCLFAGLNAVADNPNNELVYEEAKTELEKLQSFTDELLDLNATKELIGLFQESIEVHDTEVTH